MSPVNDAVGVAVQGRHSLRVLGWGLRGGAFANLGASLVHGFLELGWDARLVVVHAPTRETAARYSGTPFDVLGSHRTSTSVPALTRYLRQETPDVLMALSTALNIPAIVATSVARRGTAVVVTEHMNLSEEASRRNGANRLMRLTPAMVRLLYPRADGLVSVNSRLLTDPALLPVLRDVPHAVIGNPYTWDVVSRAAGADPHPWLDGQTRPPTFVAVGRLVKRKGFDLAIRALAVLRDRSVEARLVILGEGVERSSLEGLAGSLGLADYVQLPGFVENPLPTVAAADALVMSSTAEGSPMALLEAMPLGIPIIATSAGGTTAEIVTDGHSGIVVPDGDPEGLARAMAAVINEPQRAVRLATGARLASGDRSPRSVAERYADFFTSHVLTQAVG
jgi:glycosyltransferase involved in cell wall biosynthesis